MALLGDFGYDVDGCGHDLQSMKCTSEVRGCDQERENETMEEQGFNQ